METPEEWVRVGSVEQTLSAEPIPEAIATTLRAEPGSMAIAIRRVYRLTDAQLVEVAFNLHPPTASPIR